MTYILIALVVVTVLFLLMSMMKMASKTDMESEMWKVIEDGATLDDCIYLYTAYDLETVINDGKVTNFVKGGKNE